MNRGNNMENFENGVFGFGGEEENNKVEERHKNRDSSRPSGLKEA